MPDLPQEHDPVDKFTYYDYFNIFWPTAGMHASSVTNLERPTMLGGYGGYMNQFVPQLMLGNALANSSNDPDYDPQWIQLETWHIGAQYFMGLCPPYLSQSTTTTTTTTTPSTATAGNASCRDSWIPKAATGDLIAVNPGEVIETTFRLVKGGGRRLQWQLRIGVLGQPHRTSVLVVDRPFLGLVPSTTTWDEDVYEHVYVGSCCLENYGMIESKNYPPSWQIRMEIWSPGRLVDWKDWRVAPKPTCDWQPKSTVMSNDTLTMQRAIWKANLEQAALAPLVPESDC